MRHWSIFGRIALAVTAIMLLGSTVMVAGCAEPAEPTAPTAPAEPTTPTAPAEPTTPTAPAEPTTPAELTREQQLIEGAKQEGVLRLWVHNINDRDKILGPFKEKYPFLDIEIWQGFGTAVMTKVLEERVAPKYSADVLTMSEIDAVELKRHGLLAEYDWPNTEGWVNQPPHNYWRNHASSVKLPVYNPDLVPPERVPQSWEDLKDPYWKGNAVVSSSGQEHPMYWAWEWSDTPGELDWEKSFSFWTEVVENAEPAVMPGFGIPTNSLVSGENQILFVGVNAAALQLARKGAPLAFVPGIKGVANLQAVMLMKNAPHPNAARLFIDWMTSDAGLELYTGTIGNIPNNPRVTSMLEEYRELGLVDYDVFPTELTTEENAKKASDFWLKLIGLKS